MADLEVFLFGRFRVRCGQRLLTDLEAYKTQELFCYLLLHRQRPHSRETLSDLLWPDIVAPQSKRYLRKALWQIQATFQVQTDFLDCRILQAEPEWVQLNPDIDLWLDVTVFERAFELVRGRQGRELDMQCIQTLEGAVGLYRGDLLEGCYQDWCIYERERLEYMYLAMLDKLMDHCEACQEYEAGLAYGNTILRYDRARERTHRRLMRLHYLARDRTSALRQYELCVAALEEELGVGPARQTTILYEQIRADHLDWPPQLLATPDPTSRQLAVPLIQILKRLKRLDADLIDIEHQVRQDIQAVELTFGHKQ